MQNLILLAVICVGFFYALYRVYKNSDRAEGGFRLRRQLYELSDGRRLRFTGRKKTKQRKKDSTAHPDRTVFFLANKAVLSGKSVVE